MGSVKSQVKISYSAVVNGLYPNVQQTTSVSKPSTGQTCFRQMAMTLGHCNSSTPFCTSTGCDWSS